MSQGTVEEDRPGSPRWGVENWVFFGLFGALTLAGVVVSSGAAGTDVLAATDPGGVAVPPFVYVYATMGALGYVFTKLMADVSRYDEPTELGRLVEMGMRVPAAWILGGGFYLVLASGGTDAGSDPHLVATVAFLVGLYVNVAIKSLGSLADRLLGRGRAGG